MPGLEVPRNGKEVYGLMIVYANTKHDFMERVSDDTVADYLENQIKERLHRGTSPAEKKSWHASLARMGLIVGNSAIPDDAGIAIEYTIPMSSKRIDFLVSGYDEHGSSHVVIVELKQWSKVSAVEGMDGIVETYVGGREGQHLHPSYQVWSYAQLLHNFSSVVQKENIGVWPCAYLHNYKRVANDPIDSVQYHFYESKAPAFTQEDASKLKAFIGRYVRKGDAGKLLFEIENGEIRPAKALQDALAGMLDGNPEFVMIDEQKEIFESILYYSRMAKQKRRKEVLIVKGGPGTGKSVVAINALVELIKDGQVAQYVTKNSAPRNVFAEKLVGTYSARLKKKYSKAYVNGLFRGSVCYVESKKNEFGTIVVDEAHRLNEKSGMFHNQGENQIKETRARGWNLSSSQTWAIDEDSVNEAGCIHTCQGLEFEHVGVIIGTDMFLKDGEIQTDFTKRARTDQSPPAISHRNTRCVGRAGKYFLEYAA